METFNFRGLKQIIAAVVILYTEDQKHPLIYGSAYILTGNIAVLLSPPVPQAEAPSFPVLRQAHAIPPRNQPLSTYTQTPAISSSGVQLAVTREPSEKKKQTKTHISS